MICLRYLTFLSSPTLAKLGRIGGLAEIGSGDPVLESPRIPAPKFRHMKILQIFKAQHRVGDDSLDL